MTPEQIQQLQKRLDELEAKRDALVRSQTDAEDVEQESAAEAPKELSPVMKGVRKAGEFAPLAGGVLGTFVKPGLGTAAGAAAGAGIRETTRALTGDRPSLAGSTARVAGQGALGAVGGTTLKGIIKGAKMATAPGIIKAGEKVTTELAKAGAALPQKVVPSTAKGIVDFVNQHNPLTKMSAKELAKKTPAELYDIRRTVSGVMDSLRMGGEHASRVKAGLMKSVKPDLVKIKKATDEGLKIVAPNARRALSKLADAEARQALARGFGKQAGRVGAIAGGAAIGTGAAQLIRQALSGGQ